MIKGYLDLIFLHAVLDFNPPTTAIDTPFLEIVKKIINGEDFILVGEKSSCLGIITRHDLLKIMASGVNFLSLRAKNICQDFPRQINPKINDVFALANLIYQQHYSVYGLTNEQGELEGLITPKSLCQYLLQDYFYQKIPLKEVVFNNIIEVSPHLSLLNIIHIISKQNLQGVKFYRSGETTPIIITIKDLISQLTNPQWKTKTIQEIEPTPCPSFSDSEPLSVLEPVFFNNSLCLVTNNSSFSSPLSELKLKSSPHLLMSKSDGQETILNDKNISLISPENLLPLFTSNWQHNYLLKQQQQLQQLKTTVKVNQQQVKQEKLFSQLSYRIRQSLDLNQILNNTAQEVRQFLDCDRVIIYQLDPQSSGVIIAESVRDNVLSILGKTVEDYCFIKDFIQPYLEGRIQVTDNVFSANLSPCHLDLLLSIQVYANLVVPIVFQSNLWGLLAAQNCTSPREWQEDEVALLQKLATQVAIAIQQGEYAQKSQQIAHYQTVLAQLGNIALVSTNLESLMNEIVKVIAQTLKVSYCDILEIQPNSAAFVLKATKGWSTAWVGVAKIGTSPRWMPGYALSVQHPVATEDLMVETRFSPSPFLHNEKIVSGVCVNIGSGENCYGILGVYTKTKRKFIQQEIDFLQTIANILATAIEKNKSQLQLDCFFNLSLDMFCITGIDGSFKRVNSSFLTTLGYEEKDLVNRNLIDFVHQEDRNITLYELEKLGHGFPSTNFENRWRCKDGEYRWLAWKSLPYEEGYIYSVARDISLAKRAEEELKTLNEKLELRVRDRTEELEEATEKLHTFVQTAGTVLVVLNQDYRILEWNEEAEKIFGWTRDSVMGEDYFLLFVPPQERKRLREQLELTISQGKVQRNLESKILTNDGNERCLLWNINRFVDKNGEGIGVIACGQDIEEVRMAQLRLKLSEERFRSIFNQAAVGIVQVSLQGKFILFNDKFVQLVGYPPEQLATFDFHQLIHPDDVSDTLTDLSDLIAGNRATFEREIRIQCHNDNLIWVNLTMSIVWVAVEPSYFIAVINDISDRKEAEESLQKSEARLNSILNSLQDVVWSISLPVMKLRYINPACKTIFGRSPEELIAEPSLIWKMAIGEEKEIIQKTWQNLIDQAKLGLIQSEKTQSWELEYKIELPSGKTRWIRDRAHIVYDQYGRAISIDGISSDVTERHEAEDKLFKSLQEKEVLLKEIHHRVKNNLYVISGLLNLQSSYIEDEKVRNLFQDSQNRIQTMAVIHEQLYQSQDLAEIDFADYINRLISNLFFSINHQPSGIKPILQLEPCCLNIETAIPAGLLINELVTNAFKHAFPNQKGELKINLEVKEDQQITLTVADNGKGFPPNLDWENSPSLGLRLVRLLTQQLDAELNFQTSENGTIFSVQFIAQKLTRNRDESR
jgi:PAS domain S-box-containing protein